MIHQSAFNDVVTLLNKNAVLGKGMVFEKAYAGALIRQPYTYSRIISDFIDEAILYEPLHPSVRRSVRLNSKLSTILEANRRRVCAAKHLYVRASFKCASRLDSPFVFRAQNIV